MCILRLTVTETQYAAIAQLFTFTKSTKYRTDSRKANGKLANPGSPAQWA